MFNIFYKFIYILLFLILTSDKVMAKNNIYQYNFEDIDGKLLDLDDFEGKPILLVNTASKCGFTPQYGDLQKLFQKYKNTDLIFIATPSNDFKQELSSEDEIKKYCLINYLRLLRSTYTHRHNRTFYCHQSSFFQTDS